MRNLYILFLLAMLVGCQNVMTPKKPDNLIPKDKMVDILQQAYLTNAARGVENKTIVEKGIYLDSLIYYNNNIDSLQFARSNEYYASNLNEYSEIFRELEKRLDLAQRDLDSLLYSDKPQQKPVKAENDSIL